MAEFVDVIRQRDRMCNTVKDLCDSCPLSPDNNGIGIGCCLILTEAPDIAEKIIMKWAAENQEQQYPTWVEWLKNTFGTKDDLRKAFCPKFFGVECDGGTCLACLNTPIPAYIADKLGIKPKEV